MPQPTPIVSSKENLAKLHLKMNQYRLLEQRERCTESLREFVEAAWSTVDPSPFMANWALDAVCLPYSAKIITSEGEKCIGEIVESRWQGKVLSFNHSTSKQEWKSIATHMKSAGKPMLSINGGLCLTDNHPVYVFGKGYIRADQLKVGDNIGTCNQESKTASSYQLQALRQNQLRPAFTKEGPRILFNGLLQRISRSANQKNMPALWWEKSLVTRFQILSEMLRDKTKTWTNASLRLLWKRNLAISRRILSIIANTWGILQSEMFWYGNKRTKSPSIHQWQQHDLVSSGILGYPSKSIKARWAQMFSMPKGRWYTGRASYRSRQEQQQSFQFGVALSRMPSCAARAYHHFLGPNQSNKASCTAIYSIERCAWVPDAVYNIEVLDNNNYFAENILVHNCDHLEAVMLGHIPNLLINIPPRCAKTTIVSIMFPAWIWLRYQKHLIAPLSGPQVKFLCASYSDKLTLLSSTAFRRLVEGEWYQSLNPDLSFMRDQNTKSHMDNSKGGSRQSTSVGGTLLGLGGDILIGDDLNNTETEKLVETGAERIKAVNFWNEFRSTRRNDPRNGHSAVINVQQRTNEGDVSGSWLDSDDEVTHLMIPMRHDPLRHSVTVILPQYDDVTAWEDPREPNAEDLMWPERFNEFAVAGLEKALGPYMASGRLQQMPSPKGGGILQRDYWVPWSDTEAKKYDLEWVPGRRELPEMELVVASLDTAYKEKEENDYNAFTIWGIFLDRARNRRAMLMHAWMKRLPLNGKVISAFPHETKVAFEQRMKDNWGLVDWVADGCKRFKVKRLLIEDKSRGHDVANEIRRLHSRENWGVQLINPVGDKISRAHSVVPLFTDDAIYAPYSENTSNFLKWADQVVTQCQKFPKDNHDDLVDSVTQFLNWARDNELLVRADEMAAAMEEAATYKHKQATVSEQYGVG